MRAATGEVVGPAVVLDRAPGEDDGYGDGLTPAPSGGSPAEVIARLRAAAGHTEAWHIALLQAVGEWSQPEEYAAGRYWRYVIGGEALDWLTLAQRLVVEIAEAAPAAEVEALLFQGRLPGRVSAEQFRRLIGPYRYTAHLNFQYGVVVEEALQLVAEEAMRKSRYALCYGDSEDIVEEAFRHLYGETRAALAAEFAADTGGRWGNGPEGFGLTGWQELTYRLFKRRVRRWHPARVASDTRRGLERLRQLREGEEDDRGDGGYGFAAAAGEGDIGGGYAGRRSGRGVWVPAYAGMTRES